VLLAGGETVSVAGMAFEVLAVPGHSPAHLAYHADGCLFSGDVLFAGSVGRTDFPGSDWDTLVSSIRMLVDTLPADTVVYPGHGPITTLGDELARNPFLSELRAERTA
jgi:hydroxyacylglutathione hydrolase